MFIVLVLIILINGSIIPHGCEGNSLCDEKPDDYPQEEIDYFLQNNPAILKRMKREMDFTGWSDSCKESQRLMPELEDASGSGGNCETKITCEAPFPKIDEDRNLRVIVRSKFFSQKIRQVKCSTPRKQCFSDLTRYGPPANCTNIEVSTTLHVYDTELKKVETVPGIIYADCACILDSSF